MNWIQRKIYLYNVTFGLFMLDWWERYLFTYMVKRINLREQNGRGSLKELINPIGRDGSLFHT